MPPAGIAVALGVSLATATIISSVVVSIALTVITTVVGMLLQRKPKKNPLTMDDRTITVRQPLAPRQIVQGAARVGGTIFFLERLGSNVWLGIIWASEEIKGIDSIYADDEQIFINGDGSAFGSRNGEINVYHHLGSDDQTVDEALNAAFPKKWTTDHRLRGRAYSVIKLVGLSANWENNIPNFSASIRGGLRYDPRTGLTDYNTNSALAILNFLTDERYGYGKIVKLEDIDINNFAAEANICDEEISLPPWEDSFTMSSNRTFTVNTTSNAISFSGGGFNTGTAIYVISTTTLPAPLVINTLYYVRKTTTWVAGDPPTIVSTLHPTRTDAINGTNTIDFTTTGTGTHTTIEQFTRFELTGDTMGFSGNAATDVIVPDEFIWRGDLSISSDRIVIVLETTGSFVAQITQGAKYGLSYDAQQIYTYPANVGPVLYAAGSTGTFTLRVLAYSQYIDPSTAIDLSTDIIDLQNSRVIGPIYTGLPVRVFPTSGGTIPTPLVEGEVYYAIAIDSSHRYLRLAATPEDAAVGKHIDLTAVPGGQIGIESGELPQKKMRGITTGMACEVYTMDSGVLPSPLVAGTVYYIIRTGQSSFSLATTRRNALDGVAIGMTDSGTASAPWNIRLLSEPRYTACGIYDTDQDKGDVLRGLLSSCAGKLIPPVGNDKWKLVVGAYRLPLVSLSEADATDGITLQARRPRRDSCNTIKGTYAGPRNFDQPASLPVVSNSNYLAEDNGEELAIEMNLPFTESEFAGVRLLKIELARRRKQRTLTLPTTLEKGLQIELTDGVDVSWSRFGWNNKSFEVVGWSFDMEGGGNNEEPPIPRVTLELVEMGPEIYR